MKEMKDFNTNEITRVKLLRKLLICTKKELNSH